MYRNCRIRQKTPQMPNLDHFLLSDGHLKLLCKQKYRLPVHTIRFRVSCKKSTIEPKIHILLNTQFSLLICEYSLVGLSLLLFVQNIRYTNYVQDF